MSKTLFATVLLLLVAIASAHRFSHEHDEDDFDMDVEDLHVDGDAHTIAKTCFPVTMQVCVPLGNNSTNTTNVHLPSLFNSTSLYPGHTNVTTPVRDPCEGRDQYDWTDPYNSQWYHCCSSIGFSTASAICQRSQYNWPPTYYTG